MLTSGIGQIIAQGAQQLISVVTITLVAHRLGADAFGIFSIIFVFTTLWAALTADPGLNLTVLQRSKDDPVLLLKLARTTLGMSYIYAPFIGILMVATAWITYGAKDGGIVLLGVALVAPSIVTVTISSSMTPIYQHAVRVQWTTWIGTIATALILVGSVIVLKVHDGVIALVVVSSVVGVLQAGAILLLTKKISRPISPLFNWVESWRLVRQATPIFLNMLVIVLYIRLDAFLLSVLSTPSQVAVYSIGFRIVLALAEIPSIMMTTSFAFLTSSASDMTIFNRRVTQLWELALTFGVAISCAIVPISGIVMGIIGGHSYATGGRTLSLLLLGTSVQFVSQVGGAALFAQGKQNLLLAFSVANLCINGGINLVLIPRYGANGAAIAYLISATVGAAISMVWLVHLGAITVRVRALLSLIVMASGVLVVGILVMNLSDALRVVLAIVAGGIGLAVLQFREIEQLVPRLAGPVRQLRRRK